MLIAQEYAGFWLRLWAWFLDVLILSLIDGLIVLVFLGGGGVSIVVPVVWVAYCVCFWAWRGQTPGKMIADVKVVRRDGSKLDWGHALLRCLGYVVSAAIVCVGYFWIAFDGQKQGLHDKIADTCVIKV